MNLENRNIKKDKVKTEINTKLQISQEIIYQTRTIKRKISKINRNEIKK